MICLLRKENLQHQEATSHEVVSAPAPADTMADDGTHIPERDED
jgi:hypothetical protein